MKQRFRTGGLAAWSVMHPVGVSMITLTVIIIGLFSFNQLNINLLPHVIAPEIHVRIIDTGVPASIMEDRVTRQLEEQLAITEDTIAISSTTTEGRSAVDLSFPYETDINNALRDASIRLDRAKRFLPISDEAPVIYKHDPSQIPIMDLVISSSELSSIELRKWADYIFSKWFLNLPGLASIEVGGGLQREIRIVPDQEKLARIGLSLQAFSNQITRQNIDSPGGKMISTRQEVSTRSEGRFKSLEELKQLPIKIGNTAGISSTNNTINLNDIAQVLDHHKDEKLRIRLNKIPGVKLSIQKQPQANTIAVVNEVKHKINLLRQQNAIPTNIQIAIVGDQSIFVNHAINNASLAAASGALLAMIVIYLFLGSIQRTLIIGTAIPIGIMVTFIIMQAMDLSLNIMTLGGLALGMGLLIDSTIVMLENITRHQLKGHTSKEDAVTAAIEVNSPIVASTSTNLAALLPFLFIGGMSGLLFQELIITITSAMIASLIVALTLVPALGASVKTNKQKTNKVIRLLDFIKMKYKENSNIFLKSPGKTFSVFFIFLILAVIQINTTKRIDLPRVDEGKITVSITGDPGMQLAEMDSAVDKIETLLLTQNDISTIYTTAGGFVYGRSEFQRSNRSSITIQLKSSNKRKQNSDEYSKILQKKINTLELTGFKVSLRVRGIRGFNNNHNHGSDDVSIHIRGDNLNTLTYLGEKAVMLLETVDGLRNVKHSYEEVKEEINIRIDRQRAAELDIDTSIIGDALKIALEGKITSNYLEDDKDYDIRVRLPHNESNNTHSLQNLMITYKDNNAIRLGDVAYVSRASTVSRIVRSQQQRIVEVFASFDPDADNNATLKQAMLKLTELELPKDYVLYDNNTNKTLNETQQTGITVLFLAIFLVFAVMSVQYESLRNPIIIMLCVPFAIIGVAIGLALIPTMSISMPIWLGLIMLTGIVVNNAIVLVEQIEIERIKTKTIQQAVSNAAAIRLRPILMTTLTTVFGMMPLAIGLGEGSEMLQPLAFVIVWGLSFSLLVSLILVPSLYTLFHRNNARV